MRLGYITGEEQPLDFRQGLARSLHDRVVRSTGPQRLFVELNVLHAGATNDHRAQPAIADRKRAIPFGGRLAEPDGEGRGLGYVQIVYGTRQLRDDRQSVTDV